jgi:GNAT superfamily N-acetyltransferase
MSVSPAPASNPLPGFVDLEFSRRLELAETMQPECVEALRRHNPEAPIATISIAGGTAFFGGVDYPANQIVGLGLYGEVGSQELDQVEEFYRSRGVSSTIVVSPMAHPSLLALVAARGYRIVEFNSVLIRPISADEPLAPHPGITIEQVTEETSLAWARAIARGFSEHFPVGEEVFTGMPFVPGALAFLARVGETVVGGGAGRIIPEAKIAALFGAATLPEYRRRGVQTAVIARRLHEAALAQCEFAVVSTQPGSVSQRNMERRGFRLAYTKLVMVREWDGQNRSPAFGS